MSCLGPEFVRFLSENLPDLTSYRVPAVGLEPTHPCGYQILSLARLPFRHSGMFFNE